jgi:hypothetical protein
MKWRHWVLGFLITFAAALLGVLVAEYLINRFDVSEPFYRSTSYEEYTNVVLVVSRVQPAGVYVRYRNSGTNTITAANFKFKYYEKGQLVEESDESYLETVPPGQTTEGIITPERYRGQEFTPIPLKGRTVKVICTGGYTTED